MKTCFKCRVIKPLEEFYEHPQMADGRLNKCRECTRRDVQENRARKVGQYRAYDRKRHGDERRKRLALSKKRHADHQRARFAVHNAIARGKLQRQPCEVCGAEKVDAHHDDYTQPLAVRWLCRSHHMQAHRMDDERRLTAAPF